MSDVGETHRIDTVKDIIEDAKLDGKVPDQDFFDFTETLKLKKDHANRPLWVTGNLHIFMEKFSPHYKDAYQLLVAIAEPLSRTNFIHEYELSLNTLYTAFADTILANLGRSPRTKSLKQWLA